MKRDSVGRIILYSAGVNCLYKDSHVNYVRDGKVVTPMSAAFSMTNETLFNNAIWEFWSVPGSDEPAPGIKPQIFYFYMYDLIGRYK
jgi:hypothetical protein